MTSVKLCAASVSSARLFPKIPAMISMTTNAAVNPNESARRFVVCVWVWVCIELSVYDVIKPQREQARDVIVFDGVKDLPARFARADEVHLPQPAQLMRDS